MNTENRLLSTPRKLPLLGIFLGVMALVLLLASAAPLRAQTNEPLLHCFQNVLDSRWPLGHPIADKAGNLYGTTNGISITRTCCVPAFELFPPAMPGGAKPVPSFTAGVADWCLQSHPGELPLNMHLEIERFS